MASVATPETVWVGFMDELPVIGKLKEGVDWVLALYEGNMEVVKEKEMVIEKLLTQTPQSEMMEGMEKLTLTETPPTSQAEGEKGATAAGASASGLQSVTEVKIEELLEYVREGPGGRKGKKGSQAKERAETAKKVEKIKKELVEKIRLIKPNFTMVTELSTEMTSKRGKHVFNNDILKFHSKVLKDFIDTLKHPPPAMFDSLFRLRVHTLHRGIIQNIEQDMVVEFDETEFYVNANAILYGVYSKELRDAYLHVLKVVYPKKRTGKKRLNKITDLMNRHEIYVDPLAKVKWINYNRHKQTQFDYVKDKVVRMYKNSHGVRWCEEVKEIVKDTNLEHFGILWKEWYTPHLVYPF